MRLSQFKNPKERLKYLENELNIKLSYVEKALIEDEKNINCENLIGATTLPLGVAGPLIISSVATHFAEASRVKKALEDKKNYYIPLATTEGALVASVNRGCKVITLSGGAVVNVHRVGTTRGPVFYTGGIKKSNLFYKWIKENEKKLGRIAENTSSHLKFIKAGVRSLGYYVYVRFYFNTGDAMGMNMVTIATQKIVEFSEKETNVKCLSVAGNFDIDKKPAWLNFISNRGTKAWAEVVLPKKIIEEVLKSNANNIFEVWLAKCMLGSAMSGSLGFNAQFANVTSAFFAATGQDLAHTVEGSMGITFVKPLENGDLYFSVYMPAIMIGTVGGGTKLKIKQEALSIIGAKTSEELTEVFIATVLAGEISLLSSLEEGTLAKTHERLGR